MNAHEYLAKLQALVSEGMFLTMGLIPCEVCHSEGTRMRTRITGATICQLCWSAIEKSMDHECTWTKPPYFRETRRSSDKQKVLFVGGAANGEMYRRGSKVFAGTKQEKLLTWPVPILVERNECLYVFDEHTDLLVHVA